MKVLQIGIVGVAMVVLAGCSVLGSDGKHIDYGSAAAQARPLEVPPDLTVPGTDDRTKLPQGAGGTATTYSDYTKGGAAQGPASRAVLPQVPGVRLERNAAQRWLRINDKPENVWPVVQAFWIENGLTIKSEEPAAGVMETDWVVNRAKLSQVDLSNDKDNVTDDGVYSVGERDQYRTRLERGKDGASTEVYITHRGMEEVYSNDKKVPRWQARGNDPEKEAILLQRLMVRFGSSEAQAASAVSASAVTVPASAVTTSPAAAASALPVIGTVAASGVAGISTIEPAGPAGTATLREVSAGVVVIIMNDRFDRAWRKVGLAITSSGLQVEDKDRDKGIYYLRPVKIERGWWESLKLWQASSDAKTRYRVSVKDGGSACEVSVIDQDGANSNVTKQMVETIYKNINQ
jgi:outer membrane protein assembly factor BamC